MAAAQNLRQIVDQKNAEEELASQASDVSFGTTDHAASDPPNSNMRPRAAAAYLNTTESTLADWRLKGFGPKFAKVGRAVIYRQCWLDEFIESRAVTSTAEARRLGMIL
ncbi:MAG: hypothetical protein RIC14_05565 [Filomicrobium sp.]